MGDKFSSGRATKYAGWIGAATSFGSPTRQASAPVSTSCSIAGFGDPPGLVFCRFRTGDFFRGSLAGDLQQDETRAGSAERKIIVGSQECQQVNHLEPARPREGGIDVAVLLRDARRPAPEQLQRLRLKKTMLERAGNHGVEECPTDSGRTVALVRRSSLLQQMRGALLHLRCRDASVRRTCFGLAARRGALATDPLP